VKELHHIWWNMTLSYGTWLLCTWHDSLIRLSCAWHDFPPFLARLHHVWHDSFISHMDGLKDTWLGARMESWYGKFKSDMKENIVSFIGLFCKKDLDLYEGVCIEFSIRAPHMWRERKHTFMCDMTPSSVALLDSMGHDFFISDLTFPYDMGWLRLVGSLKLYVSFAEYRLFYRALLQTRL